MHINLNALLTVTFTLFAVIDIVGSVPLLLSLKHKMGAIQEWKATLVSGALMVLFLYVGEKFLNILGVDKHSFAVAGSIVIFILGLEMVLGIEFFKSDKGVKSSVMVPIAFPLIAGSGTLTTIMSLKANYDETTVLIAILINLVFVYLVLKSLNLIERVLGPAGLITVRKFFGVILLAIAVKIFSANASGMIISTPADQKEKTSLKGPRSTMDSIRVSEAPDPGSIPGEATHVSLKTSINKSPE
jgi:multiple antibiotic resistance protein